MFEIESVADRMVRIDDTYIPAVNIQIEGFPCVIDGDEYEKYFEVLFEVEDHIWEVYEEERHMSDERVVVLCVRGPIGTVMDLAFFDTWSDFKDFYLKCRVDPFRGHWVEYHLHVDEIKTKAGL